VDVVGKIKEIGVKIRFGSKRVFNPRKQKRTDGIDDIIKNKQRRQDENV